MKRSTALLTVLLLVMAGCVGSRARTGVLIPALESAWPQVRTDAVEGGLPDVTADSFGNALQTGDAMTVVTLWPAVKDAAEAGIQGRVDAGLVSVGVAASLRERLSNIDEAVELLKQRPP